MTDRSDSPGTSWVVRLVRDDGEEAPALVGPFESEDDATRWTDDAAEGLHGWTWWAEPVVAPDALAGRWTPVRRHLRLVS